MKSTANQAILTLFADATRPSSPPEIDTLLASRLQSFGLKIKSQRSLANLVTEYHLKPILRPDWKLVSTDLRAYMRAQGHELALQIGAQPIRPRIAAFDMDSTLIQAEVIDEFARELGRHDEVAAVTAQAMKGNLLFEDSLAKRVALLKGLSQSQVDAVCARIQITPGAKTLIAGLRSIGCRTLLLSGGFIPMAKRLEAELGLNEIHANSLAFKNGICTGLIEGAVIGAEQKANLLNQRATELGVLRAEQIAVGDGANDMLMLAQSGLGVAFQAKPIVEEMADFSLKNRPLSDILYLLGWTESQIHPFLNS